MLVGFLWHINLCKSLKAKSIFIQKDSSISSKSVKRKYKVQLSKKFLSQAIQFSQIVLIQEIQFSIFFYAQLNDKTVLFRIIQFSLNTVSVPKTVLFQTFQFSISTQFSSIWPIDRAPSSATTSGQSGPGSDGNERAFPKALALLEPYRQTVYCHIRTLVVGRTYPSAEKQSVYSTHQADWAMEKRVSSCKRYKYLPIYWIEP